jgi:hypothetical protein
MRSHQQGKVVTWQHSSSSEVKGLSDFIEHIQEWDEISRIEIRRSQQNHIDHRDDVTNSPGQAKRKYGGNGFSFKATRDACRRDGTTIGIHCRATDGTRMQLVVLSGANHGALKERLRREGLGGDW